MYRSTNMSVHQAMSCHDHATCQDVEKPRKSLELSSSLKTTMAFIYGSLRAGQFCAPITARQVVTCFGEPIGSLEMAGFLWQQNLLLIKVSESNPESDSFPAFTAMAGQTDSLHQSLATDPSQFWRFCLTERGRQSQAMKGQRSTAHLKGGFLESGGG